MTTPLSQTLNREFPHGNYRELGQGHWLKWQKSYLSHAQEGWKIVHLNLFQRIARRLFGSYESTHLKIVAGQLCQEKAIPNSALLNRMINAWKKAYPQKTCPFSAISSNTPFRSNHQPESPSFPSATRYEGIPGEWYIMKTSQIKQNAPNACTSIALVSLNSLLSDPVSFTPGSFNKWIEAGSQKHLDQYEMNPVNRYPKEVIKDLRLNHLNTIAEVAFSPNLVGILEDTPQTPQDLTTKMIEEGKGKPFAAALSDGRETIALYYKNDKEIYILDSHQKSFQLVDHQPMIHLDMDLCG